MRVRLSTKEQTANTRPLQCLTCITHVGSCWPHLEGYRHTQTTAFAPLTTRTLFAAIILRIAKMPETIDGQNAGDNCWLYVVLQAEHVIESSEIHRFQGGSVPIA